MIAAIKEMAEKRESNSHTCTSEYLQACSMIFEYGILSHEKIQSATSRPLANMAEGMKWFYNWKEELQAEPGYTIIIILYVTFHINDMLDVRFRSPIQKVFLAWQVK